MNHPSIDVAAYLQSLPARKVLYCPNPGNAGDSLIAAATYQLFEDVGIGYQEVTWDESFDANGQILIYAGGGNLTNKYPNARRFIERHHRSAQRLILFPHTVQGHADLLEKLGDNVHLFCREARSLDWVHKQTSGPRVDLADDLALRLDPARLAGRDVVAGATAAVAMGRCLIQSAIRRFGLPLKKVNSAWPLQKAWKRNAEAMGALCPPRTSVLYALRVDGERRGAPVPPENVDVSQVFEYGVAPSRVAFRAASAMLSYMSVFERIVTNRLHGCIAGALLGKQVDFYANSYFKNEAVYAHSLKDQFSNVRWRGTWGGITS